MTVGIDVTALKRKAYLTAIIALTLVVRIVLVDIAGKFKIMETRQNSMRGTGGNQGCR